MQKRPLFLSLPSLVAMLRILIDFPKYLVVSWGFVEHYRRNYWMRRKRFRVGITLRKQSIDNCLEANLLPSFHSKSK